MMFVIANGIARGRKAGVIAALGMSTGLAIFISDHGMLPWAQFLVLGAILILVGLVVDATVGFVSGALSQFLQRRPAIRRWMDRVSAAIFGALAVRLVADPH
ncbi:LysE family transporter [Actinosynnema sp. ALI-1.44]|uniref:LysE family transporter n=1 Tax=Actinosynnema sp. ALI-1.44 TaxID=1933779 RepID=UPI003F8D8309